MIALLDYGSGNLRSVQKALLKAGADVRLITEPDELKDAQAAVLPGVGAFDDCISAMQKQKLLEGVKLFIQTGRPFLGICVGYQALFEKSEEFNSCAAGLSIFKGKVVRFSAQPGLKVPQMGGTKFVFRRPVALFTRESKTEAMCISSTAFSHGQTTLRSWLHGRTME